MKTGSFVHVCVMPTCIYLNNSVFPFFVVTFPVCRAGVFILLNDAMG